MCCNGSQPHFVFGSGFVVHAVLAQSLDCCHSLLAIHTQHAGASSHWCGLGLWKQTLNERNLMTVANTIGIKCLE